MLKRVVSAVLLIALLASMLTLAFNIKQIKASSGTIYIRADGSIDPPTTHITSVDNATYTFTDNINEPIVVERSDITIDGNGYTLQGLRRGYGLLPNVNDVTIMNTNIKGFEYGIWLESSSNDTVVGNNITDNSAGIWLTESSSNNDISENNIAMHSGYGILLGDHCSNNSVTRNNIKANDYGIIIYYYARYNNIVANTIAENNNDGVWLSEQADYNCIVGNNVTSNKRYGVGLRWSSNNSIYHNNFVNNRISAYNEYASYPNIWDYGYPSGGNYWSDNAGADSYSGPYQNIAGSDGIGDKAYVIDGNNKDDYPLMHAWSPLSVHDINTGLGYSTIQEAIDANGTLNGHAIFVEAGTYSENVVVNKTISLIGENRYITIIIGNVLIQADQVQFENFSVEGDLPGSGITLSYSSDSLIIGNKIVSKRWAGIMLMEYSSNNTISNNFVVGNEYGINIGFGGGPSGSNNNTIANNVILNNTIGMEICVPSTCNRIFGNSVENNSDGGILILDVEASGNRIYHNSILHNGEEWHDVWHRNAEDISSNNWDVGYSSGGNYWSDYNGTDLYSGPYQNETGSDGIGDSPYTIDANSIDRYPLMQPYVHILGDLDEDRTVDILDAVLAASAFGTYPGHPSWNDQADLNYDNKIDILDIIILANNFGKHS